MYEVVLYVDGHKVTLHLHDMLYVPNMSTTLISVSQLLKRKGQVVFERPASGKLR
jgi:Pol polyprotein